ncbi:efflux transporter outer membrane subunit [Desulfofustis glycolicus]|uniref:Outer membrane protein, multidrug efflux system n=1 Tax=Desulfofustis glycolicus DSM 9705 TaxID=1121409 RepID=A0A1M5YE77_9BACT|nr:efflux transporter outer membrane subunit [Desulfofustis glycolicus]MCB2215531.1 efflux transporter outer membrane subunit [Desulfobulbaceae bacterium]SHI09823.1 outer membrane protein, multidrug efflux system [Desulfofustis glycolicus DSM 9705]
MSTSRNLSALIAIFGLLLGGCSLTPSYQRPDLPVADNLIGSSAGSSTAEPAPGQTGTIADLGWRTYFPDPTLQRLIDQALAANRDLRISALNIAAYQAQYRIQRAALLPGVDGDASAARQRTLVGNTHATGNLFQVKVGLAAYELDFFGRLRSLEDKALENYLAMEQNHRSALINLIAEVAGAYLNLLADRELLAITKDTRRIEEESFELIKQRVKVGIANELALAQARTNLEAVKANLALYQRRVAQDRNYLDLLTGGGGATTPATADEGLLNGRLIEAETPPSQLSSRVLLQRPDIMAAEHELKAANADIGAARAAFFPAISLTANAGLISTELDSLFNGDSGMWLFSPAIRLPIFTGGRLEAQLDVAQIRKDISIARYEKAIQVAFKETADSLVAVTTYRDQMIAQQANLEASQDYHAIASQRYEQGLDSFLTLLDAQRSLYGARQNFLSLKLAQLINQITLYKVLGGGWQEQN